MFRRLEQYPLNLEQSKALPQLLIGSLIIPRIVQATRRLAQPRTLEQKLDIVSFMWYTGCNPVGEIIFNAVTTLQPVRMFQTKKASKPCK